MTGARSLLAALWRADIEVNVAALDGGKVRDLFDLNDPLLADIDALLASPAPSEAGLRSALPSGVMESCTRWHRGGVDHYHYKPVADAYRGERPDGE